VVRKLFAFLEKVPQEDVCILSACGTVSSLTLCQPDVSNGFSRHEVSLLKQLISYICINNIHKNISPLLLYISIYKMYHSTIHPMKFFISTLIFVLEKVRVIEKINKV